MTNCTDKALIFANWPDGKRCFFPFLGGRHAEAIALADRIDYVSKFMDGFTPVAWAPAGTRLSDAARAESIAAGRVIVLVDGRYVARGMTPTLDKLEAEKESKEVSWDECMREVACYVANRVSAHYADPNAAMIARDGAAKPQPTALYGIPGQPTSTAHAAIAGLTRIGVVDHRLGSAFR